MFCRWTSINHIDKINQIKSFWCEFSSHIHFFSCARFWFNFASINFPKCMGLNSRLCGGFLSRAVDWAQVKREYFIQMCIVRVDGMSKTPAKRTRVIEIKHAPFTGWFTSGNPYKNHTWWTLFHQNRRFCLRCASATLLLRLFHSLSYPYLIRADVCRFDCEKTESEKKSTAIHCKVLVRQSCRRKVSYFFIGSHG